ncbi:MAG: ATP-dependent Clp protease adapter ClpS [Gammaproteobacteria bacterium]|nr:ATP-dependent Clp protease adapter ClpS [Gammaproteobacteria bacterium]
MNTPTPIEKTQTKLISKKKSEPPRLYQVVLLNDDFTPMDFVTRLLIQIFNMDELRANQIMLEIHHFGQAICGVYPREIAEMKVSQVLHLAHQEEHPLHCVFELAI